MFSNSQILMSSLVDFKYSMHTAKSIYKLSTNIITIVISSTKLAMLRNENWKF